MSLSATHRKQEDIEELPEGTQDDENEDDDEEEEEGHSEDEKADQEDAIQTKKQNQRKNRNRNRNKDKKPRTNAEKVLDFDPMLWTNGKMKDQKSFESRYRQLMENIVKSLELAIFNDDDWIIKTILEWCEFLARKFQLTQFRRLGTFTAFAICTPLVQSMSKQRKPMEKLQEQLEQEKIKLTQNKRRGSPRKKQKIKIRETSRMKQLNQNIEDYKLKIRNLQTHTNTIFEKIAAYKASDASPLIRCMVLQHLVKWINIDPSTDSFLTTTKYQYIFYGLQDKQSSKVRATALECMMDLFDFEKKFHGNIHKRKPKKKKQPQRDDDGNIIAENAGDQLDKNRKEILEPFWDRIRDTVNALLKDKDSVVVKKAIEFINILLRGDMLDVDDGECILNYIFDENDEIRQVAAQFIFHDTFDEQAVLKTHEATNTTTI